MAISLPPWNEACELSMKVSEDVSFKQVKSIISLIEDTRGRKVFNPEQQNNNNNNNNNNDGGGQKNEGGGGKKKKKKKGKVQVIKGGKGKKKKKKK